ncbi:MAG TPA: SPFH domain-containing protein [Verrucomicrobiae bacterium]|nr:SPFH domain-containing protein [Verrucomicrobiae bacterium]
MDALIILIVVIVLLPFALMLLAWICGVRYIPHNKVGIIEKLWSPKGSLREGQIVARNGEAGFQTHMLRGGLHLGLFPWQYSIHREPLVTVSEGKIAYVYARDGAPLPPTQTLGAVVESNSFQDAPAFLTNGGQRGRQRAILREGVYAINLALFVVIAEDRVHCGPLKDKDEKTYQDWQQQLLSQRGFDPVLVGYGSAGAPPVERDALRVPGTERDPQSILQPSDTIGIVTVQDGTPIASGEIIAPEVEPRDGVDHHYFQDPEAFLALGGRRGKQLQVLTDGTFFINRWFATVEIKQKTLIPIGFVGVIVSYYGTKGEDVTGAGFRYGEQVEPGRRGVWREALPPGKYALNPYALKAELVPTVNFVLRWITGQVEAHQYDKDLSSIDLITADGYEPVLPLSLVLHIDYEKASRVVQRFGDVRRLISQTLDPILTAYFRDVAQSSSMLDLLTHREDIQKRATEELGRRFQEYDINCVAVLIGRPESQVIGADKVDPIERLFDQLRQRRLAEEQKATFAKQQDAAAKQRELNEAQAAAEKQTELTQTRIDIEVSANKGEAQLAEAQRLAKRDIARAEGESRSRAIQAQGDRDASISRAEGESRAKELIGKGEGARIESQGRGEASRIAQIGLSEAAVNLQKIRAYGDPRLYAVNLVSDQFARSTQPIVPERVFIMGGGKDGEGTGDLGSVNLLSQLLAMILSEKAGIGMTEKSPGLESLEKFAEEITKHATEAKAEAGNGKQT